MYNYNNFSETFKNFMDSNPAQLYSYWTYEAPVSEHYRRALDYSQARIYSQYMASLNDNPSLMFGDYLSSIDPKQFVSSLAPEARGVEPRQFNRRSRWITF